MSDVFDEIDEEIRKERMEALWKKFAPFIIGLAVLVVASVAGYQYLNNHKIAESGKSGDRFLSVLNENPTDAEDENTEEALLALVESGYGGYPQIAKFRLASDFIKQEKIDEAEKLYADLIVEVDQIELKNIALIRYGYLLLEKGDISIIENQLTSMQGVWSAVGKEIAAVHAFGNDDFQRAVNLFDEIARDSLASNEVRQRADKAISVLAASAIYPEAN